jgi:hypothetical protein
MCASERREVVDDQFDILARQVGTSAPRRRILQGVGGLILGALGIHGLTQEAEAKNKCKKCRNKCQKKNKRKNNKNKTNCGNKCHNECKNKNKNK